MASAAAVDSLPEPRPTLADDTASRSNRRGRSRKRKSGDTCTEGKKRTFDDFFNFCSFVLAYEEQLERQALSNTITTKDHTDHAITTDTNSTHTNHTSLTLIDHKNTTDHTNTTLTDHHDTSDHTDTTQTTDTSHTDTTQIDTSHTDTTQIDTSHTDTTHTNTAHHHTSSSSSSNSSESGEDGERGNSSPLLADVSHDKLEYTSEDESWNLVTCFCRRPFAGRPMIECSKCNTWVHLFCAKIRKNAVPEVYTCPRCASPPGKVSGRRTSVNT